MTSVGLSPEQFWADVERRTAALPTAWAHIVAGRDHPCALPTYLDAPPPGAAETVRELLADRRPVAVSGRWLSGTRSYVGICVTHPDDPKAFVIAAGGVLAVYRVGRRLARTDYPDEWCEDPRRELERQVLAWIAKSAQDRVPDSARAQLERMTSRCHRRTIANQLARIAVRHRA